MPGPDSARSSALGQNGRIKSRSTKDSRINARLFAWVLPSLGHLPRVVRGGERSANPQSAGVARAAVRASAPSASTTLIVALDRVEHGAAAARSFRVAGSTKGKAGLKRYYAALRRLRNAYNSLDPAIRPWFSLAETVYVAGKATSSTARSQGPSRSRPAVTASAA